MTERNAIHWMLALLLALAFATPALATDGVREINQTMALAGNVTAGDFPGFPVTISEPGSYKLTGNLVVGGVDQTAIEITSNDVTLDLKGFALQGPVTCFGGGGLPATCSAAGFGNGIVANTVTRLTVRDGTIAGFGNWGMRLGGSCRLYGLTVSQNGDGGIDADDACLVRESRVTLNDGEGILMDEGLLIETTVEGNSANGVEAIYPLVRESSISGNADTGLFCDDCLIQDSSVSQNAWDGIDMFRGLVSDCQINANGDEGLQATPETAHLRTVMNENSGGSTDGNPSWFGWSVCNGDFGGC